MSKPLTLQVHTSTSFSLRISQYKLEINLIRMFLFCSEVVGCWVMLVLMDFSSFKGETILMLHQQFHEFLFIRHISFSD